MQGKFFLNEKTDAAQKTMKINIVSYLLHYLAVSLKLKTNKSHQKGESGQILQ